jgi:hypothetical protein
MALGDDVAVIAIDAGRFDDPFKLIAGEVVDRHVGDLDPFQCHRGILDDVVATDGGPEEADHSDLTAVPRSCASGSLHKSGHTK